ncbi:protein HIDE1 isoform X1 [Equus asinus]|uniref:protein HIDE1 isoform X1 n=1 Tax=Equus asinus TaxID=9793 RepID=UPI0038F7655A
MPWTVLLFAAGSLAIPAPTILLVSPHPSSQEDPIYIECEAPEGYPGANFTLYQGEHVVQLLQAPADQFKVTFNLSGGSRDPSGGPFNCQYGVLGEHMRPQLSEHSDTVDIPPGSTRILVLSLSLAGALLLLAGLVTLAVVVRKVKVKKLQKKRERESCWAQMNFDTTDMSFDNSLFAISSVSRSVSRSWFSADCPYHGRARTTPGWVDLLSLNFGALEKPGITEQGWFAS